MRRAAIEDFLVLIKIDTMLFTNWLRRTSAPARARPRAAAPLENPPCGDERPGLIISARDEPAVERLRAVSRDRSRGSRRHCCRGRPAADGRKFYCRGAVAAVDDRPVSNGDGSG